MPIYLQVSTLVTEWKRIVSASMVHEAFSYCGIHPSDSYFAFLHERLKHILLETSYHGDCLLDDESVYQRDSSDSSEAES